MWFALTLPAVQVDLDISQPLLSFDLTIPAIAVNLIITEPGILRSEIKLPAIQVSGNILTGGVFAADLTFPAIQVDGLLAWNALRGAICGPAVKVTGAMVTGGVISGDVDIPAIRLLAKFAHYNSLAFDLDIPAIATNLLISGVQAITVQGAPLRRGFVMNLSHFGVTEYNNFPFNSFCDYHGTGTYIGASEEGIFLLDGDDDNGVGIEAVIQTGTEDLWDKVMKRLREGWAVKRGGPISVQLILDEGRLPPVTRPLETVRGVSGEERAKFPRGLKNRFVSFVIRNSGGNDFSLESFRAMVDPITHRKR